MREATGLPSQSIYAFRFRNGYIHSLQFDNKAMLVFCRGWRLRHPVFIKHLTTAAGGASPQGEAFNMSAHSAHLNFAF